MDELLEWERSLAAPAEKRAKPAPNTGAKAIRDAAMRGRTMGS